MVVHQISFVVFETGNAVLCGVLRQTSETRTQIKWNDITKRIYSDASLNLNDRLLFCYKQYDDISGVALV